MLSFAIFVCSGRSRRMGITPDWRKGRDDDIYEHFFASRASERNAVHFLVINLILLSEGLTNLKR